MGWLKARAFTNLMILSAYLALEICKWLTLRRSLIKTKHGSPWLVQISWFRNLFKWFLSDLWLIRNLSIAGIFSCWEKNSAACLALRYGTERRSLHYCLMRDRQRLSKATDEFSNTFIWFSSSAASRVLLPKPFEKQGLRKHLSNLYFSSRSCWLARKLGQFSNFCWVPEQLILKVLWVWFKSLSVVLPGALLLPPIF